jgi:hypothetical protein
MKKVWLIAGAFVGCVAGASLGACSSGGASGTAGNPTTTSGTQSTSTGMTTSTGSPTASSSGTATGGSTTTSTSGGGGGGGTTTSTSSGTTCKSDPTLHPSPGGTIYCGFDADGGTLSCNTGEQCCVGGSLGGNMFAPDVCSTWGMPCTNPPGKGLAVPCEQPSDCTANGKANNICCLMGTAPAQVPGCDAANLKASGGQGTQCMAATTCGAGNTQLCLADSDCPTGQTCHAFRWKIIQLGACM